MLLAVSSVGNIGRRDGGGESNEVDDGDDDVDDDGDDEEERFPIITFLRLRRVFSPLCSWVALCSLSALSLALYNLHPSSFLVSSSTYLFSHLNSV